MIMTVLGQTKYDAIRQALGLTDAQIEAIQRPWKPEPAQPDTKGKNSFSRWENGGARAFYESRLAILDDQQRAKLAEIEKSWNMRTAEEVIALKIIPWEQFPWRGGICTIPWTSALTPEQVAQLYGARIYQPTREQVWPILTEEQKSRFEKFEKNLPLLIEAVSLNLIPPVVMGEVLCH